MSIDTFVVKREVDLLGDINICFRHLYLLLLNTLILCLRNDYHLARLSIGKDRSWYLLLLYLIFHVRITSNIHLRLRHVVTLYDFLGQL